MKRYLVDHKGQVWTHPAQGLGEALGYPQPDFDMWAYAIRNLGAVEIAADEDGATVTMRTATAHSEAIRGAQRVLATLGSVPIKLRYEIGTWIEESYEHPAQAAAGMLGALETAAAIPNRMAFVSKSRKLNVLSEQRLNRIETVEERLGLVFKKWRLSQGRFDPEMASFLVRFGLFDRTAVVVESKDDAGLVFEHSGTGFNLYDTFDKSWNFRAQGARLVDQPDPDYGRWIDRTYRGVLDENQPRFEHVDAVIQARGGEPYRSRYDRLLLPWRTTSGTRVVTGTSYHSQLAA